MFDRIKAAPSGVGTTARGLTPVIDLTDWRAVMDSSQDASAAYRHPSKWNSVEVPARVALRAYTNADEQPNGCWISRYSVSTHGYAQIGWSVPKHEQRGNSRHEMVLAHRASWVHIHGQVPIGMTIDHACKERRCVNPAHLRLMSNRENARRNQGDDFREGFCRRGHPDSMRVPVTRRTKAGMRRTGYTCGPCVAISRSKWVEQNKEKLREIQRAYRARRRAA